uniref:Uncharacterized protein n=1 Tax=Meloidogyne enterolobii TaxID=390850 RepID=A0A6V7VHK8_MELEN|nr:unnamed protein product [Meloidogyne enterolobii]
MTKWVDEELNNLKLKDCLEEYHVLTGYEFKRTIKYENSQIHQSLLLIGFNLSKNCFNNIKNNEFINELEILARKLIEKLNIFLSENIWIDSIYLNRIVLDKRFQELRRKILTKDMPTSSSATFNHNTPFNNKIKIEDKEINEIKVNELTKILQWPEIVQTDKLDDLKLDNKDNSYVYFPANKFQEENMKIYNKNP